jgi:hypothetical protein
MYLLTVALLMFVLPVCSILAEALILKGSTNILLLAGKWFVFWAAGVRQSMAGVRQMARPRLTSERIFGISLFFGLAGTAHVLRKGRNLSENVAMVSDLFLFVVLLVFLAATFGARGGFESVRLP